MKYSINSSGYIVAERDIYSLGGFIPKNSVGCKVANGDQISQDGECWVSAGDLSGRPDVRVKDNAYIGEWVASSATVHTDGITEFSGSTVIPGKIVVRNPIADPVNNFFAKDSFIGVSMDVLCGPEADTTTAFPFEQGDFKREVAKGTLFTSASMRLENVGTCRSTATLRLGRNTYLYIPPGYRARVFWAYYDTSNQLAYSGESALVESGLTKFDHSVYRLAMVSVARNRDAMTPTDLLATGAKILGHISGSVLTDIRPESASGEYVMDNSSFIVNTDNFGLDTIQLRFLAGSMYNTNMYTKTDRQDYKPYGTFRNVERLEYTKYLDNSHRTAAKRDKYISAYDCPLLRVDGNTYDDALAAKGNLVLRRCTVPKAEFQDDVINGNTYEDIDFSFANEDLGYTMTGYTRFTSSHKQGIYRMSGGPGSMGFVSHKGNLADTARLFQEGVYLPLDGNLVEQGSYGGGGLGSYYESSKSDSPIRVRTGKPLPTFGLVFPSLPAGYSVEAFYYLDEGFIIRSTSTDPTGLDTTYPYVVMLFRRDNDSAINVTDFIALNRTLRITDHAKAPEITGSAYVGAGCTVRGDVKLIGDPYVNRLLDVNMWERGENTMVPQQTWEEGKNLTNQERHFEFKNAVPVETGGTLSAASGYFIYAGWMDENKRIIFTSGAWAASFTVPANAKYVGLVLKKAASAAATGALIEDSDIPLANVKYVRPFKKRRYIVNELDRTSPEDILLSVDYWEQGTVNNAAGNDGKPIKDIMVFNTTAVRLKTPVNYSMSTKTIASGFAFFIPSFDAGTRYLHGVGEKAERSVLKELIFVKSPSGPVSPSDAATARIVIDFIPSPRIVVPYGSATLNVNGVTIRMYDNAVLSRNLNQRGEIVLQGDAVMGYDFNSGECLCSNGHSDAIIKLP